MITFTPSQSRFIRAAAAGLSCALLISCGNAQVETSEAPASDSAATENVSSENAPSETLSTPAAKSVIAIAKPSFSVKEIAQMSPSELMSAATQESNTLADVLAEVTDEATANDAIAQMRALGPQLKALGERVETLGEGDMKISIKTMKQLQGFAEAQMRVFNETGRITTQHPELREVITDAFEDLEIDF